MKRLVITQQGTLARVRKHLPSHLVASRIHRDRRTVSRAKGRAELRAAL